MCSSKNVPKCVGWPGCAWHSSTSPDLPTGFFGGEAVRKGIKNGLNAATGREREERRERKEEEGNRMHLCLVFTPHTYTFV